MWPRPTNVKLLVARSVSVSNGIALWLRLLILRSYPTQPTTMQSQSKEGGIKGFLSRAGKSFYAGGLYVKEKSWMAAKMAGNVGFVVATTSIVVLMPLIFEIMREGQVRVNFLEMNPHAHFLTHHASVIFPFACLCLVSPSTLNAL